MLLHLLFKDAPRVLNRVQVWRHTWPLHYLHFQLLQEGSGHLGDVLGVVIMLKKLLCVPVSEGDVSFSASECYSTSQNQ